jgi:single-stranded DNA-binding protein
MTSGYNCATIHGRFVGTPEEGKTKSGDLYLRATISLSTYRRTAHWQGEEANTHVPVMILGKTAEFFAEYVKKGDPAHMADRLDGHEWIANGKKGLSLSFIAETICFLPNSRNEEAKR